MAKPHCRVRVGVECGAALAARLCGSKHQPTKLPLWLVRCAGDGRCATGTSPSFATEQFSDFWLVRILRSSPTPVVSYMRH